MLDIDNLEANNTGEVVLVAKNVHCGMLHRFVNRGGVIPLNNNFSIRLNLLNDKFMSVQLIAHSVGNAPKQSYHRVKREKVIIEKTVKPKKPDTKGFSVEDNIVTESAF